MSKTRLEELYEKERADKFKMTALDWQPARCDRELLPTSLDAPANVNKEYYRRQMSEYKQRFGMDALQVEGLARNDDMQSLADRTVDNDRQRAAGMKLATAKVLYKNVPTRLWIEVTKH